MIVSFEGYQVPLGHIGPVCFVLETNNHRIKKRIAQIKKLGLRLTCEFLSTKEICFCIEDPELGDFKMTVATSKETTQIEIRSLLLGFSISQYKKWKKQVEE